MSSFTTVKNNKPRVVKVYHPDGKIVKHKVHTKHLDLDQLSALIGGGYIETFSAADEDYVLIFDEDGTNKGLAPNYEGSLLQVHKSIILCGLVLYCPVDLLEDD